MNINTKDALHCTLEEDVFSSSGNLILPAGVSMTEGLINALLKQGIHTIEVVGMSRDDNGVPDEGASEEASYTTLSEKKFAEHIEILFIKHKGSHMKEFKQCLLKKSSNS